MATTNPVVRARIDKRIKTEAEAVLASMGLTVSEAFRNAETIEAMKAARRGKLTKVGHPDGLLESLNADD